MTHVTYTQQALSPYKLPRLKRIAAELGVTPTGDRRATQTWVNAIITDQSTKLQKVDNQALAQAELDSYIADQAQAVAPEPLRIVEISFSHHEYYAGNQLIAGIVELMSPTLIKTPTISNRFSLVGEKSLVRVNV